MLTTEEKRKIIKSFQEDTTDTGSTTVQIALLSADIAKLTEHFKTHHKDNHSRYGMRCKVSQRRRLLKYLKQTDSKKYFTLIDRLKLRDLSATA